MQKLPFYLQEKWLALGSKYKEESRVPSHSFRFFVDFVCQLAKLQNDPSFTLAAFDSEPPRQNEQMFRSDSQRAVAVLKTGVSPNTSPVPRNTSNVSADTSSVTSKSTNRVDPAKHCLLHNKSYPLPKCRGFREEALGGKKST